MAETIFIGVAWPYANGPLHQGQIVGSFLPADVFARYHRLRGNTVLMVSGSDQHGTPITVRAEREGRSPQQVVDEYHRSFVEGTCPYCGYQNARGDECEQCSRALDAMDLVDPRCKLCGATPEPRESEHYFLRLSAYSDRLRDWIAGQSHWRKHVVNFSLGMLNEGLRDRAITRDLDWGSPLAP